MALTPDVYLEIDVDNKRARVIDNSNYSEEDIVLASQNAKGLGIVTSPTGDAIFNGSSIGNPLVNLAVSTNGQYFNLPLDSNGAILNGTYSFTYSVRYAGTGSVDGITATSSATLEFFNAGAVLIAGDAITFSGNANAANNGVFTVSTITYSVGSDNSSLTVTQTTLVNDVTPTGTYSYDVTRSNFASGVYTYTGCSAVVPTVQTTYDCESTQFGQIIFQDVTNLLGQALVSRELIGYYPNALNPAPPTPSVDTTDPSLTFNELAVGTWTHKLTLNMSVTQDDGLVYTYSVVDTGETAVTCVGSLCSITPCLQSLSTNMLANYQNGTAGNLIPILTTVNTLIELANQYKSCGETAKYAATVAQLQEVLNESGACDCGCCDESQDVPYWVNNAGFSAQTIIEQLVEDVATLQSQVASQVTSLFNGKNFYGASTGYPNTPLAFTNLGSIEIPASYLDFPTTNGYGTKRIEIDIDAETGGTGGNVSIELLNGTGTTLLDSDFEALTNTAKLTVRMVLLIEKDGTDYNLWALTNTETIKGDGTVVFVSENNVFANALTSGEVIELNLRPVDAPAELKTTYTYVSIVGKNAI